MTYKIWKDEPFDWAPTRKLGTQGWIAYKSGGKAPPPADYVGAARETARGNLEMARAQTEANRVNQTNPYGSLTYTNNKAFDQAGYDAAMASYNKQLEAYNAPVSVPGQADSEGNYSMQPMARAMLGGTAPAAPKREDFESGGDSWSSEVKLVEPLQNALDSQLSVKEGKSQVAEGLLDQLKNAYSKPFEGPDLAQYLSGVKNIDQDAVNVGDYTKGLAQNEANAQNIAAYQTGTKAVNQNVAQFDPNAAAQYQKAAYDAGTAFTEPQNAQDMKRLRESLALQGLSPDSEAMYGSTKSLSDTQAQARNQLINQSLLTGTQIAQGNYNTYLGGVKAGNDAQNQSFTQGVMSQQADISAQNANNTAKQNNYGNAQKDAQIQAANVASANDAKNQAYAQALSRYQTQYATDYAKRTMPLQEINSLLAGEAVQSPEFNSYNTQGQTTGPDLSGALASQQAQAQAKYNADSAAAASSNGAVAGLAGAAMIALGF